MVTSTAWQNLVNVVKIDVKRNDSDDFESFCGYPERQLTATCMI